MAKNVYIGVQTSHTYTNMLGGIGDMETGAVYKTTAEAAYLKNSSQHKFGSGSQAFQQSDSATELTYTLRNSAGQMSFALDNTHTYYFSVWINQKTSLNITFDCYWPIAEPPIMSGVKNTALNTWEQHSAVFTRSGFTSGTYPMRIDCNNYPGNNAMMNVDGMMLVDLTATYGAGNEPAKEFCDQYFAFTTGTNTVTIPTARQIKNMFIGVGGKARKVKKAYVGVGGKARLFYTSTLPPTTIELWNGQYIPTCVNKVYYANGYYVAIGSYNKGSGNSKNMLSYTSDLSKGFTSVELAFDYSPYDIIYANGYWVIACYKRHYTYLLYATSLNGAWTKISFAYNKSLVPNSLCYANGYWVIGGTYGDSAYISYATDLEGSWTNIKVWDSGFSDDTSEVRKVIYADGYWVAAGLGASNNPTYKIAYTTSPNETWTTNSIYQETGSTSRSGIFDIVYANGVWACAANEMLLYSNDIMSSSWTSKDIGVGTQTAIIYADGYWVVVGSGSSSSSAAKIGYSSTLAGNWIVNECFTSYSSSPVTSVAYGDGYYLFGVESEQGAALVAYAANPAEFDQF